MVLQVTSFFRLHILDFDNWIYEELLSIKIKTGECEKCELEKRNRP